MPLDFPDSPRRPRQPRQPKKSSGSGGGKRTVGLAIFLFLVLPILTVAGLAGGWTWLYLTA